MVARRKENSTARPSRLVGKVIAVIGYGSQGRAVARNLRDSGCEVVVGLRTHSRSEAVARRDGLRTAASIAAAVRRADIVAMAFPDHLHRRVFKRSIKPNLKRHVTLWFLHATSVHFGLIKPSRGCDVVLIAPHAPGDAVRETFLTDRSLSAFYGVAQNRSKQAGHTARALATAIGVTRSKMIRTSFEREAVGDLFGEQAVLCGGLAMLIKHGFQTLVDHGWQADNAYLEVAYQLDLIVALIKKHGVKGMLEKISPAARLGSAQAGPQIIDDSVRDRMDERLAMISSGRFAQELEQLDDRALATLKRSLRKLTDPRLEKAARKFSV